MTGKADVKFLERCYHKNLLYFTHFANRFDLDRNDLFQAGFLGLDNIQIIDRSRFDEEPALKDVRLEQADATAWMAFFALCMLQISLELALHNRAYEDMASKFLEHFLRIKHAIFGGDLFSDDAE